MFPDEDPPEAVWDLYGRSLDDHIASLRQQAADASATDVIMAEEEVGAQRQRGGGCCKGFRRGR